MQSIRQLIASKAAAVFISDENLGWLPITLPLIISLSFDLCYNSSVRYTHLFICFASRKIGTFLGGLRRLLHMKNVLHPCAREHTDCCVYFVHLYVSDVQRIVWHTLLFMLLFLGCFCFHITHTHSYCNL